MLIAEPGIIGLVSNLTSTPSLKKANDRAGLQSAGKGQKIKMKISIKLEAMNSKRGGSRRNRCLLCGRQRPVEPTGPAPRSDILDRNTSLSTNTRHEQLIPRAGH